MSQKISIFSKIFLITAILLLNIQSASISKAQILNLNKSVKLEKKLTGFNYITDEIIVKYKPSVKITEKDQKTKLNSFSKTLGLQEKSTLNELNAVQYKITDNENIEEKIAKMKRQKDVLFAQPNYKYRLLDIDTNDPYKGYLWAFDNAGQTINGIAGAEDADIDLPEAWNLPSGENNEIIVAVIDTGVSYNHPDLIESMWDGSNCVNQDGNSLDNCVHGYDFENYDLNPDPSDSSIENASHGTHIAGILAAQKNNATGITGISSNIKIMALKTDLTSSSLIDSINFAKRNGAKVINASWSFFSRYDQTDLLLKSTIENFGGMFITAAGNDSGNNDLGNYSEYPCKWTSENIICVASTDQQDSLSDFSNYGATSVDLAAPGENILSTSSYKSVYSQNFQGITPPNLPLGFQIVSGDPGTSTESGNKVLVGDVDRYPYSNNASNFVASPTVDLSEYQNGYLSYDAGCDTSYDTSTQDWHDYMTMEMSINGSAFDEIKKYEEATLDSWNDDSEDGTGTATYYFHESIDPSYLTSTFRYGFGWISDDSDNNYGGCYADNINLTVATNGANEDRYSFGSGTSYATPMVVAATALLLSHDDSLSISDLRSAIINEGDDLPSLAGKTVSGKRLNVYNSILSIENVIPPAAPVGLSVF